MKKIILLISILAFGKLACAQESGNIKLPPDIKELLEEFKPTDTLSYDLPNNGTLMLLYDSTEYKQKQIDKALRPVVKKATKFPEGKTFVYRLYKDYEQTSLEYIEADVKLKYTKHPAGISLHFPFVGLSYIGGHFTPESGMKLEVPRPLKAYGISFTNYFLFRDRPEGGVRVEHNPFLNAEFSFRLKQDLHKPERVSTIQVGYLLHNKSSLFSGTTLQVILRHKMDFGNFHYGVIMTDNLKTVYPMIGFKF